MITQWTKVALSFKNGHRFLKIRFGLLHLLLTLAIYICLCQQ